jgi:hypothetical protein
MLILNVDFFSSGKVCGWTNSKILGSNEVMIKTDLGLSQDISESINIIRPDVNSHFEFNDDEETGFNINLFDVFNNRVKNFDIYVDGYKAWSSLTQLEHLEDIDIESKGERKKFFEIGGRRLIVVCKKSGTLDRISQKLNLWNRNQFNKSLNNGVAISFMNVDEFRKHNISNKLENSDNIFMIDRSIVRDVIIINNLVASFPIIIIEKKMDLSLDYSGVLNSIFKMNGFMDKHELSAILMRTIIETITTYSNIFFAPDKGSLLHVYGEPSVVMMNMIREQNQSITPFNGCLVISKNNIVKISDFDKNKDTIFINNTLLRNTFDIVNSNPVDFLKECLKRGIKVNNLKECDKI